MKVYGPAVDAPVKAHCVTYLIVDCKEAGPGLSVAIDLSSTVCVTLLVHYTAFVCYRMSEVYISSDHEGASSFRWVPGETKLINAFPMIGSWACRAKESG